MLPPCPPETQLFVLFHDLFRSGKICDSWHKTLFFTVICGGNEKGRGEIGFQKVVLFKSTFLDIQTAVHLDIQTTGTFYLLWNSDERWLADEFCLLIR